MIDIAIALSTLSTTEARKNQLAQVNNDGANVKNGSGIDEVIANTFRDFEIPVEEIVLNPSPARAFCNVVVRQHGAPLPVDLILDRLMHLDDRGDLPHVVVI